LTRAPQHSIHVAMHFRLALVALVCAALPSAAAAPLRLTQSEVTFLAHGSLGMRVEGKTGDLSAVEAPEGLEFQVQLATLHTGIDLRDRHMREEYLQVQQYPTARLRIPRSSVPKPGPSDGTVKGELTLHGRTHPVDVLYHLKAASGYDVAASMQVDMRDFGIPEPKYMGVSVKPQVEISVDFHVDSP
jgi:polyisoprenoid-binding protein YceI